MSMIEIEVAMDLTGDGDAARDEDLRRKLAAGAALASSQPHDPEEVERFCAMLSGLGRLHEDDMLDSIGDLPAPAGFLHCRVFDARTGEERIALHCTPREPLNATEVLLTLLADELFEADGWTTVSPLPVTRPGTLDIAVASGPTVH